MKKISTLICLLTAVLFNVKAQDEKPLAISLAVSPMYISIADGYNRCNGLQLLPSLSLSLAKVIISAGPTFSIQNLVDHKNAGAAGFATSVDIIFNKADKKFNWGADYTLSWQRFINTNTGHYNKGNYSMASTFGYFMQYKLNDQWKLIHSTGIGTGFGESIIPDHKNKDYKGTAVFVRLAIERSL